MADDSEVFGEERNPSARRAERRAQAHAFILKELGAASGLPAEHAQKALVSVLCALEQWLVRDESEDLRVPLPRMLREALRACTPRRERLPGKAGVDELLQRVAEDIGGDSPRAESVTRAVLAAVRAHITEDEAEQVGNELPVELRALWARTL